MLGSGTGVGNASDVVENGCRRLDSIKRKIVLFAASYKRIRAILMCTFAAALSDCSSSSTASPEMQQPSNRSTRFNVE